MVFYNIREGQVFNGKIIQPNWNINDLVEVNSGVGNVLKNLLILRFELKDSVVMKDLNKYQWEIFSDLIYTIIPRNHYFRRRLIANLFVLDLINSYRGWRHFKGLPTRGQRTWSNASTAPKCNTLLRNFRVQLAHRCYGNLPLNEVAVAVAAEQINLVWKIQWYDEWLAAKRNRLGYQGAPNTMKIDLYSMAKGQIMNPFKFKKLSKKQRQSFKKNHFSLGFDPGFTKSLLTELYKARTNLDFKSPIQGQLLFKKFEQKKVRVKKKVDEKAKIMAHAAKKKKKKISLRFVMVCTLIRLWFLNKY